MGLYNLTFFTAGAFGTSFVGTLLDQLDKFLPTAEYGSGVAYSVLFLAAASAVLMASLLFRRTFGWRE